MNKVVLWGDRWPVTAYSPRSFAEMDGSDHRVIVHPGWAKSPKRLGGLLVNLAEAGMFPIGVDTRWTYANQRPLRRASDIRSLGSILLSQSFKVGVENRIFGTVGEVMNDFALRRATSLLSLCEAFGLQRNVSLVGHSEGARIGVRAATQQPEMFSKIVIVNGAGLAQADNPEKSLAQNGARYIADSLHSRALFKQAALLAMDGIVYNATHPRRTLGERSVILSTELWPQLAGLQERAPWIDVSVFHASDDVLVPFDFSQEQAHQYPDIAFVPTEGGHHNIYSPDIQAQLVKALIPSS